MNCYEEVTFTPIKEDIQGDQIANNLEDREIDIENLICTIEI